MNHILKTDKLPFKAVMQGVKNFEFRLNDRDFQVGDFLTLNEIDENKILTGCSCKVQVTYILKRGYGLPDGYCIMSITNPNKPKIGEIGVMIDNYADMED